MVNRVAYNTLLLGAENPPYMLDGVPFTGGAYRGNPRWPDLELEFLNGLPHGLGRAWHPNGALIQQRDNVTPDTEP